MLVHSVQLASSSPDFLADSDVLPIIGNILPIKLKKYIKTLQTSLTFLLNIATKKFIGGIRLKACVLVYS